MKQQSTLARGEGMREDVEIYEGPDYKVGYLYVIEIIDRGILTKPNNSKEVARLIKDGCDVDKEIIEKGLGAYHKQQYKYGKAKNIKSRIGLYKNLQKMNVELIKSWRVSDYHNAEDMLNSCFSPLANEKKMDPKSEYFDADKLTDVIEFIDEVVEKKNKYIYKTITTRERVEDAEK